MTVVVTAIFRPHQGQANRLVAALFATMPAVHAEDGCELYAIHEADDGTVTMIEKWRDEVSLNAHAAGAPIEALQRAVAPCLSEPVRVTRMLPLPMDDPRGAL